MGVTIVIFIFITIFTYATFGVEMTERIVFPSVELAKEIEIIGGFIERLESLFLTVYIMAIFTSFLSVLYCFYQLLNELFLGKKSNPMWLFQA
ncbi:hypothetical protein BTR23_24230 [Alkalihalophilus pseudofirmus]|nr:hypothetical protein BTR23_24230 [Alkalihalophilus pseudofirmus]